MAMTLSRRAFTGAAAAIAASATTARAQGQPAVKLGILGDLSGPYRDLSGPGSLAATNQAIADFRAAGGDVPVTVIQADHRHTPDIGLSIARQWLDTEGVDVILELNDSAIALAVADLVRQRDKIFLATGPATDLLYGAKCGPNHVQWTYDTWQLSHSICAAAVKQGMDSWYFLTADYAFGTNMEAAAKGAVTAAGGKVLGQTRYPFPNTTDFASFLLQAQSSGANAYGLGTGGTDLVNIVKQATEFGLTKKGRLIALQGLLGDIHAIGPEIAQGMVTADVFYWNLNERTRGFTDRVLPKMPKNIYPSSVHAGAYSATTHYLKTVAAMGGPASAKASGRATVAKMMSMPTDDDCFGPGRIREDGRKLDAVYLFEAKAPSEITNPWDLLKVVSSVDLEHSVRPLADGSCPMVKS